MIKASNKQKGKTGQLPKLFKGSRSHIRNTAPRLVHGFQRYDKVQFKGAEAFVFGRRSTGYFDLRKLDGTKIHASARSKDITKLESFGTMLTERRSRIPGQVCNSSRNLAKA